MGLLTVCPFIALEKRASQVNIYRPDGPKLWITDNFLDWLII